MAKSIKKSKTAKKKSENAIEGKFRCFKCNEEYNIDGFYKTQSKSFHHIPICKECLRGLCRMYNEQYSSLPKALLKICSLFDIYYNKVTADSAISKMKDENDINTLLFVYLKQINGLNQHKGLTYEDSDVTTSIAHIERMSSTELTDDRVKWGKYTKDEYEFLNQKYSEYCDYYNPTSPTELTTYRDLCKQDLLLYNEPNNKDSINIRLNLLKSLGIDAKSIQDDREKNSLGNLLGVKIKRIEDYSPAEYYEDKTMFDDYFGRSEYLDKFYVRATRNHLLGTKDFLDIEDIMEDEDE